MTQGEYSVAYIKTKTLYKEPMEIEKVTIQFHDKVITLTYYFEGEKLPENKTTIILSYEEFVSFSAIGYATSRESRKK